jgi:hypothetical protein
MSEAINLAEKLAQFSEHWAPRTVAQLNDYDIMYELAHAAVEQGEARVRWLTAAAYDRWCMYYGKPQKYGTQYVSDGVRQRLWDVDERTTDTERAAWNVPPRR